MSDEAKEAERVRLAREAREASTLRSANELVRERIKVLRKDLPTCPSCGTACTTTELRKVESERERVVQRLGRAEGALARLSGAEFCPPELVTARAHAELAVREAEGRAKRAAAELRQREQDLATVKGKRPEDVQAATKLRDAAGEGAAVAGAALDDAQAELERARSAHEAEIARALSIEEHDGPTK